MENQICFVRNFLLLRVFVHLGTHRPDFRSDPAPDRGGT
jgi:hypothetical protein